MHRLARHFAENTTVRETRGEKVAFFWQSFTATVMREVASQLRLTTYTGPPGPALITRTPVDIYGNELPRCLGGQRLKRARPQSTAAEAAVGLGPQALPSDQQPGHQQEPEDPLQGLEVEDN